MDTGALFVVEVKGPVIESVEIMTERVSEALGLDDAKAHALVDRMPGVITRPLPEARAAKVALRLQSAGVAAVHRRAPSAEAAPVAEEPDPVPTHASEGAWAEPPRSPLADVPSVDATRVDQIDVKITPMTAAGFPAADVVVPTDPAPFPPPPAPQRRSFAAPIVEGDATALPADHEAPEPPDRARRYARSSRDTPPRERAVGVGAVAPSARARDAIARDRAGDGEGRDAERPATPEHDEGELRLAPPEVVYRSTRSSVDAPLTLSAPPDAVLKKSGVREDALGAAQLRRRGSMGRRLASLVMIPAVIGWACTAGFLWLLLPQTLRGELWVPLAAASAVAALFGALVAGLSSSRLAQDVTTLRDAAERIAMGELSHPVQVRRNDELGDVAASIDRMRVSLQESLDRLRRRRG